MKNKVVLAYSGGLDTSFCVKYLTQEKDLEVHSVLVDTGGFSEQELKAVRERAYELGVTSHTNEQVTQEFYEQCVKYLIFGNVLRNHTYPLSVSAERMFQAIKVAQHAQKIGADYIAHGSTGAGNDQVRFDLVFEIMCPQIEVLTPIRDNQLSRQQEIEYLSKAGVELPWEKAQYSINQGIWGTSVGGSETLTSNLPLPETAYPSSLQAQEPLLLDLEFKQGEPVAINDQHFDHAVGCIQHLQSQAAPYAIGRDIHVGDTIIGIKGRVGFEAAAPMIILKAHHLLEKHCLVKWQQYWKEQLANWYGMMLHEGQFMDPVMRNIEAFLSDTQKCVSGTVHIELKPYQFVLNGVTSSHDLMGSTFGQYGEMNAGWTGEDVKGFTKILANQNKIYHQVNGLDHV